MKSPMVQMPTGNSVQSFETLFTVSFVPTRPSLRAGPRVHKENRRNMAPPRLIETGGGSTERRQRTKTGDIKRRAMFYTKQKRQTSTAATSRREKYFVSDAAIVYKHVARFATNYPIRRPHTSAHAFGDCALMSFKTLNL